MQCVLDICVDEHTADMSPDRLLRGGQCSLTDRQTSWADT